ncbi:hypothetical protein NL676_008323 [Syzygium grande]|nr:hypothetical protein NL676_008323 [Syzygium grande]
MRLILPPGPHHPSHRSHPNSPQLTEPYTSNSSTFDIPASAHPYGYSVERWHDSPSPVLTRNQTFALTAVLNLLNFAFFLFVAKLYVYRAEVSDSMVVLKEELKGPIPEKVRNQEVPVT